MARQEGGSAHLGAVVAAALGGQALGSAVHWGLNGLIAFGFPIVAQGSRAMPFWFFAVAMLVQLLVMWRYFPETRGTRLDDGVGPLT